MTAKNYLKLLKDLMHHLVDKITDITEKKVGHIRITLGLYLLVAAIFFCFLIHLFIISFILFYFTFFPGGGCQMFRLLFHYSVTCSLVIP